MAFAVLVAAIALAFALALLSLQSGATEQALDWPPAIVTGIGRGV